MCLAKRPKTPELPPPPPPDSAIEETASAVVVGTQRKDPVITGKQKKFTPETGRKRMGTQSLQIPLVSNLQNLNYPS